MALQRLKLYQDISDPSKRQVTVGTTEGRLDVYDVNEEQFSQLASAGFTPERTSGTQFQPTGGGTRGGVLDLAALQRTATDLSSIPAQFRSGGAEGGTAYQEAVALSKQLGGLDLSKLSRTGGDVVTPGVNDRAALEAQGVTFGGPQNLRPAAELQKSFLATPEGQRLAAQQGGAAGGRKLGPTEFANLRQQYGVTPQNFDQYFSRDAQGNIYLKPNAPPPTPPRESGESIEDYTARVAEASATGTQSEQGISTSASVRAARLAEIRGELAPSGLPTAPATAEERIRLRQEQGIVNDEADLADLREDAALLQQELRQYRTTAGERVTEAGRLGAVSETERNARFRLENLAIREQSLLSRISTKNDFIDSMIKDQQLDYQNALNRWNQEFKINSQAVELYNQQLDEDQKDAIATITTLSNLLQESGVPFERWTPQMKQQAEQSALRAGLPKDTFSVAFSSIEQGTKTIGSPIVVGNSVYMTVQKPNGEVGLIKTGSIDASDIAAEGATGSFKDETTLRKEFNSLPEVKDFNSLQKSYLNMESLLTRAIENGFTDTTKAPADQALVTLFNRMLDPTSVVREGEYARSFQGQAALAQIQGTVERVLKGGAGLTDKERQEMVSVAETLFNDAESIYKNTEDFYRDIATTGGLDPNQVIRPVGDVKTGGGGLSDEEYKYLLDNYGKETADRLIGFNDVGSGTKNNALTVKLPSGQIRQGGTASWRNNNPLNIKFGQFASSYGATQGSAATDGGNFAAFKSEADGLKAARNLLRGESYRNLPLDAAMKRWSGNGYGADVAPTSIRNKTIGQMSDSELNSLISSMRNREGWREGKVLA